MTATCQAPRRTVPLQDVERELNQQLKQLQAPGEGPVQRAHLSNLVIFCNSAEAAARVDAQVPDVVLAHPARVLLLVGEDGGTEPGVSADVQVRSCRAAAGRQYCCEQVTLRASGDGIMHLPFAVRALLIGDLPTNLWWSSNQPPPLAGPLLYELADQAQQVIYDSLGWREPARGVAATATWLEQQRGGPRWQVASDLNWRRLKYWRRLVAQALDPASAPGAIESITELRVEHGPHAVIQAWELVSWIAQRLDWQVLTGRVQPGVEIGWRFLGKHGDVRVRIARLAEGPPELRRVRVACTLDTRTAALDMVPEADGRLAVRLEGVEGVPRTVAVPPLSPAELVGRQLSDREPDAVFLESMGVAQVLARSVLRG